MIVVWHFWRCCKTICEVFGLDTKCSSSKSRAQHFVHSKTYKINIFSGNREFLWNSRINSPKILNQNIMKMSELINVRICAKLVNFILAESNKSPFALDNTLMADPFVSTILLLALYIVRSVKLFTQKCLNQWPFDLAKSSNYSACRLTNITKAIHQ